MASNNQIHLAPKQNYILQIHPTVFMNILDNYHRRGQANDKNKTKVIGTLLGQISNNRITVTNSFSIPIEDEELDQNQNTMLYHQRMVNLNKSVYQDEVVLGSFVCHDFSKEEETQSLVNDFLFFIKNYSKTQTSYFQSSDILPSPLILTMNPNDIENKFNIKVLTTDPSLDITKLGLMSIIYLNYQIQFATRDRVSDYSSILMNQENYNNISFKLLDLKNTNTLKQDIITSLQEIQQRVQKIVDGKEQPDVKFGQQVKQLLSFSSNLSQEDIAQLQKKQQQDSSLLQLIVTLARTQNTISNQLETFNK